MKKIMFNPTTYHSDWITSNTQGLFLVNEKMNVRIWHYSILDSDNSFLYDTIGIDERPGACVIVMVNQDGNLGLIDQYRPIPDANFLSCIRGFNEKDMPSDNIVKSEILEESGIKTIEGIQRLGEINANTTYFVNPVTVYLVKVIANNAVLTGVNSASQEGVQSIRFFNNLEVIRMVADNDIRCQMTLSALMLYFANMPSNIISLT
ncbi:hypothetical protein MASR1M36_16060 [Candidatus Cloacimonadaceae bacterium]